MMALPSGFDSAQSNTLKTAKDIEGYLTEREMKFLFLLGSCPTAKGEVLEIGSFKGKSTVILAMALQLINSGKIIAVDPLTSPSITDPDLKGKASGWEEFGRNIKTAGIEDVVEFHQMFSHELSRGWTRKLRLLWIDGDHTYQGTKTDFDLFFEFLSDKAIAAFHDVLNFEGPLRVFMEDVLLSDRFGPAGIVGTIGWAQHLTDKKQVLKYKEEKLKLYCKLSRLIPFISSEKPITGLRKLKYKLLRFKIPHSEITPDRWMSEALLD